MQRARTPKSSLRIPFLVSHHNAVCSIVGKFPNTFLQPSPGEDHHPRSISPILLHQYLIIICIKIKTCSLTTIIYFANSKKQTLKTKSYGSRNLNFSWENIRIRIEIQLNLDFPNTRLFKFTDFLNYFLGRSDLPKETLSTLLPSIFRTFFRTFPVLLQLNNVFPH